MALLHGFVPMILALFQTSGVPCDVTSDRIKLLRRPNEMVKALFLPKAAFGSNCFVDFRCGKLLPRIALGFELRVAEQAHDEMDMVWHHHKVAQIVTFAIKVQKSVRDDLGQVRATKHALAESLVEVLQILTREYLVELPTQRFG